MLVGRFEARSPERLEEIRTDDGTDGISPYRQLTAFPSFITNQGVQSMLATLNSLENAVSDAVSEEEAHELYETYCVPAPGAPLFQAATANLSPWTELKVDTTAPDRGPLLIVSGDDAWEMLEPYVGHVAPDLRDRMSRWTADEDVFSAHRVDEQLAKALDRKVWLPSGGSLVIDRTEAMTVVDVNTGKFTGSGGNLEETVTKNNLEAAEEIVRQLRLRDIGGIIVIDFIDMVLESNRDLVLRRLVECLGRDRTRHQVAEVGGVAQADLEQALNIGVGLVAIVDEASADGTQVAVASYGGEFSLFTPGSRRGQRVALDVDPGWTDWLGLSVRYLYAERPAAYKTPPVSRSNKVPSDQLIASTTGSLATTGNSIGCTPAISSRTRMTWQL